MYSLDLDAMNILKNIVDNNDAEKLIMHNDIGKYFWTEGMVVTKNNLVPKIDIPTYNFRVDFAWIEVTQNCNLICRHCYEESSRAERKKEMSLNDFKKTIDELIDLGVKRIQLVGGEPLMHSQIENLIDYVAGKFIYIEIYTNGTMLTDKLLDIVKENNISLAMSIYSEENEVHDYVTRTRGSLVLTKKSIKKALDKQIPIRLASVEMKDVPSFQLNSFDVPFRTDLPRLTGRADLSLYSKDMLKRKLIKKETFSRPISIEEFYKNKTIHNCYGERLYIDCELNIYPCAMERRICYGNSSGKHISKIVHDQFAKLTKDKIDGCKDCEYRYACYDCRCDANSAQINAKPWYCTYDQEKGVWVNEDEFINDLLNK